MPNPNDVFVTVNVPYPELKQRLIGEGLSRSRAFAHGPDRSTLRITGMNADDIKQIIGDTADPNREIYVPTDFPTLISLKRRLSERSFFTSRARVAADGTVTLDINGLAAFEIEKIMSYPANDPFGSTSGYAVAQLANGASQNFQPAEDGSFSYSQTVTEDEYLNLPPNTEFRAMPPVQMSQSQNDALASWTKGMKAGQLAYHFYRTDTPDGLSVDARALLQKYDTGHPYTMVLQREPKNKAGEPMKGRITPPAPAVPFDYTVQVIQAINEVRRALGVSEDITEEELAKAQKIMLNGVNLNAAGASVFDKAYQAAQSPSKGTALPDKSELIRRHVLATVKDAVNSLPYLAKNSPDATVLGGVNDLARLLGTEKYGVSGWVSATDAQKTEIQQLAWDQWAENRGNAIKQERADAEARRLQEQRHQQEQARNQAQEKSRRLKQSKQKDDAYTGSTNNWLREKLMAIAQDNTHIPIPHEAKRRMKKETQDALLAYSKQIEDRFAATQKPTEQETVNRIAAGDRGTVKDSPTITPDEWLKMPF